MGKEGRERQVLHWALFLFRVLVTWDPRIAQGRWAGSVGGLGQNVFLFEWLLKGRMWRGWVGLPKDAKKLLVEDRWVEVRVS